MEGGDGASCTVGVCICGESDRNQIGVNHWRKCTHTGTYRERGCKKTTDNRISSRAFVGDVTSCMSIIVISLLVYYTRQRISIFFFRDRRPFRAGERPRPSVWHSAVLQREISSSKTRARNIRRFDIAVHEHYLFYDFEMKWKKPIPLSGFSEHNDIRTYRCVYF